MDEDDVLTDEFKSMIDTVVTASPKDIMPSQKYGMKLMGPLFVGIIVLAAVFVVLMMYWNRNSERRKKEDVQAKKEKESADLKGKLKCKPFSGDAGEESFGGATAHTERTVPTNTDEQYSDETSSSSGSSSSSSPLELASLDRLPVPEPPEPKPFKDGSVCAICSETFQYGQPVVESNNPGCSHQFHKKCMDKWLDFQNSCPVCNKPYALQTA